MSSSATTTTSTKTLLEIANEILLMTGERPVTSVASSPVAQKVASCLREAVLEMALLDDWSFTRARITALKWIGKQADLGDIQRIVQVYYKNRPVPFIDPSDFDIVLRRVVWTVDGYGKIKVCPEPTTPEEQAAFTFDVIATLVPPQDDNDTFPLPDRFLPLVTKRALYLFVLRHLDDAALAAQYNNEFELMTQLIRNRERYRPRNSNNIYRGRR